MRRQFRLADAARELVCRLPLSFEMKIANPSVNVSTVELPRPNSQDTRDVLNLAMRLSQLRPFKLGDHHILCVRDEETKPVEVHGGAASKLRIAEWSRLPNYEVILPPRRAGYAVELRV